MSKELIKPSEFDRRGKKMKYNNTMDKARRAVGKQTSMRPETVVIKDSSTGRVYGRRTLIQKTTEDVSMQFLASLLNTLTESSKDITTLPDQVIGEIRKLIRKGAVDLEQKWANALELVHKAYQVANVRRPSPSQKGAWKQYEELIQFGVRELFRTRGIDGEWRTTSTVIRESDQTSNNIGKRRFFVDIPNAGSSEVDAKSIDDIIEKMTNKFRRHGAKLRVDERTKKHAVLSIWVDGVKRENITVKDIS